MERKRAERASSSSFDTGSSRYAPSLWSAGLRAAHERVGDGRAARALTAPAGAPHVCAHPELSEGDGPGYSRNHRSRAVLGRRAKLEIRQIRARLLAALAASGPGDGEVSAHSGVLPQPRKGSRLNDTNRATRHCRIAAEAVAELPVQGMWQLHTVRRGCLSTARSRAPQKAPPTHEFEAK
jgi:hypothetical protein